MLTAAAIALALAMTALAIAATIAATMRAKASTLPPPPTTPDQDSPEDPGLIPLTVAETRLTLHPGVVTGAAVGLVPADAVFGVGSGGDHLWPSRSR